MRIKWFNPKYMMLLYSFSTQKELLIRKFFQQYLISIQYMLPWLFYYGILKTTSCIKCSLNQYSTYDYTISENSSNDYWTEYDPNMCFPKSRKLCPRRSKNGRGSCHGYVYFFHPQYKGMCSLVYKPFTHTDP